MSAFFDMSQICPACFSNTNGATVCPVCGYARNAEHEDEWNRIAPGTVIHDRYLIGQSLGQGGFGITYLGLDLRLNVKLAIKEYYPTGVAVRNMGNKTVMPATKDTQTDFKAGLDKFLEEARTLAMFENHPNIVSVKDFFEYNGTAYMVMNYLEGDTLLSYLKSHGGKISFEETYNFLAPIMDALDTVHASGLIHRDISPDNVFITNDGQVRLLDFGAAKSAMALMNQQNHSIVLKKGYSPSEQYREDGKLGPWTDVYSIGATFYRCITGEIPQDSIDRLFNDKVQYIRQKVADVPGYVVDAILKAMSLKEIDRFQNMIDFKTAIMPAAEQKYTVPDAYVKPSRMNNSLNMSGVANSNNKRKNKDNGKDIIKIVAIVIAIIVCSVGGYLVLSKGTNNKLVEIKQTDLKATENKVVKSEVAVNEKQTEEKKQATDAIKENSVPQKPDTKVTEKTIPQKQEVAESAEKPAAQRQKVQEVKEVKKETPQQQKSKVMVTKPQASVDKKKEKVKVTDNTKSKTEISTKKIQVDKPVVAVAPKTENKDKKTDEARKRREENLRKMQQQNEKEQKNAEVSVQASEKAKQRREENLRRMQQQNEKEQMRSVAPAQIADKAKSRREENLRKLRQEQ